MVCNDKSRNEPRPPTASSNKVRKIKYVFADFSVAARDFCCILRGCTSIVAALRISAYMPKMPMIAQRRIGSERLEMKAGS